MNMFPPLSTDMYLPALPEMGEHFSAESYLTAMTLTIFFFMFSVSMILFGPLSDKYGRKPILIAGSAIYTVASVICAVSFDIYILIIGRFFQGVGAGAVITISTVLIKDSFSGRLMSKILAITQALSVIGPMTAPLIGGFLLRFTSWRGSFFLLTFFGLVTLAMSLLLTETLKKEERYEGNIFKSLTLLWEVGKQKIFMLTLIMFAFLSAPFMAYLSVSSFIYIEDFGLTAQEYSCFFAVNAAASVAGPMLYMRLKKFMSNARLLYFCFAVGAASGILVLTVAHFGAQFFLLAFLPFTVTGSTVRPFAMEVLLNRVTQNAGTASSMINFVQTLFGSVGMMLGSLPWSNFIDGLGIIILSSVGLAILLRVGLNLLLPK